MPRMREILDKSRLGSQLHITWHRLYEREEVDFIGRHLPAKYRDFKKVKDEPDIFRAPELSLLDLSMPWRAPRGKWSSLYLLHRKGMLLELLEQISNIKIEFLHGIHDKVEIRAATLKKLKQEILVKYLEQIITTGEEEGLISKALPKFRQLPRNFNYASPKTWNKLVDITDSDVYIFILGKGREIAREFKRATDFSQIDFIECHAFSPEKWEKHIKNRLKKISKYAHNRKITCIDICYTGKTLLNARDILRKYNFDPLIVALNPKADIKKGIDYFIFADRIYKYGEITVTNLVNKFTQKILPFFSKTITTSEINFINRISPTKLSNIIKGDKI